MKIAVATEEGKTISSHFGRSPYFAVFEVHNRTVGERTMRKNTFTQHMKGEHQHDGHHHDDHDHEGHHHGHGDPHAHGHVFEGLRDCAVVISHGMGRRAWEDLRAQGIEMIVTNETDVDRAVELYLAGQLVDQVQKLH